MEAGHKHADAGDIDLVASRSHWHPMIAIRISLEGRHGRLTRSQRPVRGQHGRLHASRKAAQLSASPLRCIRRHRRAFAQGAGTLLRFQDLAR